MGRHLRVGTCGLSVSLLVLACGSARSGFDEVGGSGPGSSGDRSAFAEGGSRGIDRNAACASSVEPTSRAPGAILLVVDRSFSMTMAPNGNEPKFGDDSKWDVAVPALRNLVTSLPNGLELGLAMFPSSIGCEVAKSPDVPIADIAAVRATVNGALGKGPSGDTPTTPALEAGYAALLARSGVGERAVVFLSDGAPNCGSTEASVEKAVTDAKAKGIRTFVVGIPGSPSTSFSRLAIAGGTRKSATCLASCDATFTTTPECCHYETGTSDFGSSLSKALAAIAAQIRTSCVYEVPKPAGKPYDPGLVNVLVSVDGATETLVLQSSDPSVDGWTFTDGSKQYLVVQGPLCDKILGSPKSKVEVLVGCPTQVR